MEKIFIKRESGANEILKYVNNGRANVIFGAGSIGGLVKDALNKLDVDINSFLVNEGHKQSNIYKDTKVYDISEFPLKYNECNILYSIQLDSLDILEPLTKIVGNNILFIDGMTAVFNLLNVFYKQYFREKNIDINNKIINKNNIKLINPFLIDEECLNAFLFEIGDLVLPEMMNDYSYLNEGTYEFGKVILEENDVVFDCGANIGLFSSIAAAKGCICYAFEPVPNTIEYLKMTKDLYPDRIKIINHALSNKLGKSKLFITKDTNISHSMLALNQNEDNYIDIKTIPIDLFVKENEIKRLDFIKADIEGAERYMLMGAKETLAKFSPKLSICTYHLEDDPQVLENIIREANPNYVIEHKWKKLYAYVPK